MARKLRVGMMESNAPLLFTSSEEGEEVEDGELSPSSSFSLALFCFFAKELDGPRTPTTSLKDDFPAADEEVRALFLSVIFVSLC